MSMALLRDMTNQLPSALRDQVLGYADSVRLAAPNIARDIDRELTPQLEDSIIFFAGLRKLFSIVSSSYWSLDNSANLLARSNTTTITIAGRSFSAGSGAHEQLRILLADLEAELSKSNALHIIQLGFMEMMEAVAHELD